MSSFSYWVLVWVCATVVLFGGPQLIVFFGMNPIQAYFLAIAMVAVLVRLAIHVEENE